MITFFQCKNFLLKNFIKKEYGAAKQVKVRLMPRSYKNRFDDCDRRPATLFPPTSCSIFIQLSLLFHTSCTNLDFCQRRRLGYHQIGVVIPANHCHKPKVMLKIATTLLSGNHAEINVIIHGASLQFRLSMSFVDVSTIIMIHHSSEFADNNHYSAKRIVPAQMLQ